MLEKIKELSKDTAIYGVSTMVGRFLNFLLVPFYTHVFSSGDYGIISNIYATIGILNILFLYGMDASYLRYAAKVEIGNQRDNFSTPFLLVLFTSVFFSFIILLLRFPILNILDIPHNYVYLIYYTAPILFIDAINTIPFVKLRIERKAKKFAAFKIINILVNVFLNLFLILKLKWGIEAVVISNVAASLTSFILLIPTISEKLRFKLNKDLIKKLLKFGLPYFPAGLASMLVQGIDRPILSHLTDLSTVGIYNACYKLGIFMMLFVNMFQFAWQPFFLQNADEKNAKELFSKVLTYFTLAGSVVLVFLSLFIKEIVTFRVLGKSLIGASYWSGLSIVPVILLGYLFNGIYVVFTAGIYIKEKSIYVPFITGLGALVNIGVNFALIPSMGMMGAAFATLASYVVIAVGFFAVTQKFYKIDYEYGKLSRIFLIILIIGSIFYGLMYAGNLIFIYKIILLLFFICAVTFFVFDKKEMNFIKNQLVKIKTDK
jgi:O-antigen/teichoic acid export membrane protein